MRTSSGRARVYTHLFVYFKVNLVTQRRRLTYVRGKIHLAFNKLITY